LPDAWIVAVTDGEPDRVTGVADDVESTSGKYDGMVGQMT
jgi:hypothetical protein